MWARKAEDSPGDQGTSWRNRGLVNPWFIDGKASKRIPELHYTFQTQLLKRCVFE
jgi:hypothetical protein